MRQEFSLRLMEIIGFGDVMLFFSGVIEFRKKNLYLGPEYGVHAHAAFMKAISLMNPRLGDFIHRPQPHKCFTLSLITDQLQTIGLRVTLMGEEAVEIIQSLTGIFTPSSAISLGDQSFEIDSINLSLPPWTGIATWSDLIREDRIGKYMIFHFVSPTCITKTYQGKTYMLTMPTPRDVFRNLIDRWISLNGPALPDGLLAFIESGGLIAADHHTYSRDFLSKGELKKGFLGKVTYRCIDENASEYLQALNSLTRLSGYSGVGFHTTQCQGHVQATISGWNR